MIRAYVGSGGKTTTIKEDAMKFYQEGKKVLVITSTHFANEECIIHELDEQHLIDVLMNQRLLACGSIVSETKLGPLPKDLYEKLCLIADVVLIEADGSRNLPIKYPDVHEPVIYDNVDEITVIYGKQAIGHRLKDVCHRYHLVVGHLGYHEDDIVTQEMIDMMIKDSYLKRFKEYNPRVISRNLNEDSVLDVKKKFEQLIKEIKGGVSC